MTESSDVYYETYYKLAQREGLQGWGNGLIDRLIERQTKRFSGMDILELGASSGEHLRFVSPEPTWSSYIAVDLNPGKTDPSLFKQLVGNKHPSIKNVTFVKCDAQNLPFENDSFDCVFCTCLLAHVDRPEKVLEEMRRVTRNRGQVILGLPSDPGIMNRLVKKVITYPQMKKAGILNPAVLYAREHRNGVANLLELARFVFANDSVDSNYFPFQIKSWNANLAIILNYKIAKS
jgi:ubiquinone/menaquinone biosynthesis C-methylase UbiE